MEYLEEDDLILFNYNSDIFINPSEYNLSIFKNFGKGYICVYEPWNRSRSIYYSVDRLNTLKLVHNLKELDDSYLHFFEWNEKLKEKLLTSDLKTLRIYTKKYNNY